MIKVTIEVSNEFDFEFYVQDEDRAQTVGGISTAQVHRVIDRAARKAIAALEANNA